MHVDMAFEPSCAVHIVIQLFRGSLCMRSYEETNGIYDLVKKMTVSSHSLCVGAQSARKIVACTIYT